MRDCRERGKELGDVGGRYKGKWCGRLLGWKKREGGREWKKVDIRREVMKRETGKGGGKELEREGDRGGNMVWRKKGRYRRIEKERKYKLPISLYPT